MNLITASEVVSLAFNDKNFAVGKILDSHIKVAQEGFLRPPLGEEFYAYLTANPPAGNDAVLVNNYLKAPLAWYVRYVMLPEVMIHATSTGVQVVAPPGASSASDKQAGMLREQAKQNGDILLQVAIRYIEQNVTLFPLYPVEDSPRGSSMVLGGVIFRRKHPRTQLTTTTPQTVTLSTGLVPDVATLRSYTAYSNGLLILCNENNYVYEFQSGCEEEDDGDVYIKPGNATSGRWVKIKELQAVNL